MLSFSIGTECTKQLKETADLCVQKALYIQSLSEEELEFLRRYAFISTVGSSTRIENAILTNIEIDWMDTVLKKDGKPSAFKNEKQYIEDKLSKERERSIEEVVGCRQMLNIIMKQSGDWKPLTESTIKGLHRELLQYYPPADFHLGDYKTVPNNVVETVVGTNIRKDIFKTADPGPITEVAMSHLIKWYNSTNSEYPWAIATACEFTFRFLAIHPFQDGNGRLGRGLFLLSILQSSDEYLKAILPFISIERHIEKHKEEYYYVLRQCSDGIYEQDSQKYKIHLFLNFTLKMLKLALENDIEFNVKKSRDFINLSNSSKMILDCFKEHPEKKLQVKILKQTLDLPERTLYYALKQLVDKSFLQKFGKGPSTNYSLIF